MRDDRIDLSPLDPGRDPDRIGRIVSGVRSGITGRAAPETWTASLARAWIPALVAATVAGLLALASARIVEPPSAEAAPDPLAISIGVPPPLARWVAAEGSPPAVDVLAAMEADLR